MEYALSNGEIVNEGAKVVWRDSDNNSRLDEVKVDPNNKDRLYICNVTFDINDYKDVRVRVSNYS